MRVVMIIVVLGILLCASIAAHAMLKLRRRPIERLYEKRASQADYCPLAEIPERMAHLLIQVEDPRFFEHPGFDVKMIAEAFRQDLREGRVVTGGSTITQQLIKNLYFHFHHSILRKVEELVLVPFAEHRLGKQRILEFYMNIAYFGYGIYGIVGAARFYFNRELAALTLNQMFILACIPQAPTKGDPIRHPDTFAERRDEKLDDIVRRGELSARDADVIRAHRADCLDPQLRADDAFTHGYPQDVVMLNERFGPFGTNSTPEP